MFNTGAGRRPERLPHPPAPARRAVDDLAARDDARVSLRVLAVAAAALVLPFAGGLHGLPATTAHRAGDPGAAAPARRTRPRSQAQQLAATPKPARPRPLRDGEQRLTLAMPAAVHAVGAQRHRHRRLPLLPARPRARRGRLAHRHQRAARQPRRRPPRDPVPGPARARWRQAEAEDAATHGEGWTCFGGTGLGRLRATSTTPPGSAPGRPAATRPCTATATASRSSRARRSSCRSTTTCSPATEPDVVRHPAAAGRRRRRPDAAAHDPAARAGRAALPSRPRRRPAVRPRRRARPT